MKIFLCESIHHDAYQIIQQHHDIISTLDHIHQCEIIISRNLTIDKTFIDQCLSLKLIIIHGTGYDQVDVHYIKEKHIHLINTPNQNALSVAELIVTMMLELSRQTHLLQNQYAKNQIKDIAPIAYMGHEISGKTFGMIGVGNIALKAAHILKNGFHMKIIGYSRSLTKEKAKALGIVYCETMEDVFKQADYISIGLSLSQETYHIIDQKLLCLMKPTAYLINTSRGAILHEDDLYDALISKKIAGVGLDVLENEPVPYHHRLLQLDQVVYTPHMGGSTEEALQRIGMKIVEIISLYEKGELDEYLLF